MERCYLCIDLKTFYASVECKERHLDPFQVNLVVADKQRGPGGICLAITPKMKEMGIKNRCRLFEIPRSIHYIIAKPRMQLYMEYSANVYEVYLKYISKDDIHVYSIDEVFMDITEYLTLYQMNSKQLAQMIIKDVYDTVGIRATVGIGTNMYLAKVALDITAKHSPDFIGYLDEEMYRQTLWHHQPLTDFWRVGNGIAKRLEKYHIYDMYGITQCHEDLLYKEFGVNAEYLIDHAYGHEPTTIRDIKNYQPQHHSFSYNQILHEDYTYEDALLILKEMVELHVLNLVEHHLVTNHIFLRVGYSQHVIPSTGGSRKISRTTHSYEILLEEFIALFQKTTNHRYPVRRIGIGFGNVMDEIYETYDLFTDFEALEKEKKLQEALIDIKHKYGKNAVLKGMNLYEKATTRQRNKLIGGHNAN